MDDRRCTIARLTAPSRRSWAAGQLNSMRAPYVVQISPKTWDRRFGASERALTMATSPMAAVLDRKPGWPTGSGVLRWTSTRLLRQHTNQRADRTRPSSDLSASASAPLLPAIPQGPASGPTLPNGEAVIMPPKTRGPSGKQVLTRRESSEFILARRHGKPTGLRPRVAPGKRQTKHTPHTHARSHRCSHASSCRRSRSG
jgi:hypothetical protein